MASLTTEPESSPLFGRGLDQHRPTGSNPCRGGISIWRSSRSPATSTGSRQGANTEGRFGLRVRKSRSPVGFSRRAGRRPPAEDRRSDSSFEPCSAAETSTGRVSSERHSLSNEIPKITSRVGFRISARNSDRSVRFRILDPDFRSIENRRLKTQACWSP